MIIDAHAHLFHPRWYPRDFFCDIVSDFVRRQLRLGRNVDSSKGELQLTRLLSDDTGEVTVRLMDQLGIDKRVILILDWGMALCEPASDPWQIHQEILGICQRFGDRLVGFAGIDPRRAYAPELMRWAFDDLGAQGLKLHPTSDWSLRDERTHCVVELAANRELPVLVHVGRTVDVLNDRNSQPVAFLDLARAFPETNFIAGHSGFELWEEFTVSITKVYPPPRHQGNSPILGDIIISSLSGFVGFGWENFSQPVSSLEV